MSTVDTSTAEELNQGGSDFILTSLEAMRKCSGQQKLSTALEFFQYRFSDSFGGNPPLYSCGLSAL